MLALELKDRPKALDLVYRIQIAQHQLDRLYREVQRYAAPVILHRTAENLAEIMAVAWDQLEPLWKGRTARLRCAPWEASWTCTVDRHALESVFRNILENSLNVCADPLEVGVTWAEVAMEQRPAVEIRVCDNGPGMTPETRQKIFLPFFTTRKHGTGLGMAIAKRIVDAHGGRIAVGPAQTGAEIIVTLPKN
jgi:signal transduction histidine kinase